MSASLLNQLRFEVPLKDFQGKRFKVFIFENIASLVLLCMFLGYTCCDEVKMVSVPLGFEISGVDKSHSFVSQNGVFAFGFFETCEKSDGVDGVLVGVRYNLGGKDGSWPVWTVGGGMRVSENSTLRLSMDGRLVLFENPSGFAVWSSNTSSLGVQKATLLDSGNLVLMDAHDNVVWGSFDSPTNVLLPGQSLQFPQSLRALSLKPASSYYNLVIKSSGELALLWEHNVTYWRAYMSSTASAKEVRFDASGVLKLVDAAHRTVWSASSQDYGESSVLRHVRIGLDGNLRIYYWDKELHAWKVGWQAVKDQCNVFGFCGLYSFCVYNSTGPVCNCLSQDSLGWNVGVPGMGTSTSGCKKMVELDNCRMNTSMVPLKQMVLYGIYPPEDVDMMLSEEACKEYCSNDTSCVAVTSKNDGSGVCTIKRTSFISGYRNPAVPATSYLKMCFVPQAVSAHGVNPHGNAKTVPNLNKDLNDSKGNKKGFVGSVALIVLVTVSGFLTIEVLVFWFLYRRHQIKSQARVPFGKDADMNPHFSALVRLTFEEVKELTTNFHYRLGPSVYKGTLPNKMHIVAKEISNLVALEKDFLLAVSTLGGMYHRNLVALKGFCFEVSHKFILYEYIPNGSLDQWLISMENQHRLNWRQRLDIALGIARALVYLHTECQACIAHGNLRLENVLLDENLIPKLTDYGVRNLLQKESTSSESPPERDIYMFGEMLLQIVLCKKYIEEDDMRHLLQKLDEELNSDDIEEVEVERVVRIALWCKQNQPFLRPSIGEVIKVLEGTLSVDRPPGLDYVLETEAEISV